MTAIMCKTAAVRIGGLAAALVSVVALAGPAAAGEHATEHAPAPDRMVSHAEARTTWKGETRVAVQRSIGPVDWIAYCNSATRCTWDYRSYRPHFMWVVKYVGSPLRMVSKGWVYCPDVCMG